MYTLALIYVLSGGIEVLVRRNGYKAASEWLIILNETVGSILALTIIAKNQ
jgi:hypothetical protein